MHAPKVIEATLAFVFNADLTQVILIKKQKPLQHAGSLNGLGGKLEAGESHLECVVREVKEEAGLSVPQAAWRRVGNMSWTQWRVSIWTSRVDEKGGSFSDQQVGWYQVSPLPKNVIENLEWLVPLSLDILKKSAKGKPSLPRVEIVYSQ